MKNLFVAVALSTVASIAFAGSTITEQRIYIVNQINGAITKDSAGRTVYFDTDALCEAHIRAMYTKKGETATTGKDTHYCKHSFSATYTVVKPPAPTCGSLPPAETKTITCPSGTVGSWTQTKTYTVAPYPTCSIASEWLPTNPPAGACTTPPVNTGVVTLNWTAPTKNVDNSTLTNLAAYHIYYGSAQNQLTQTVRVPSASVVSYTFLALPKATYYFAVRAVNSAGVESSNSNIVMKTVN